MTTAFFSALKWTCLATSVLTLAACGGANFQTKNKRGTNNEQLAGENGPDCLKLHGSRNKGHNGQHGKNPGQHGPGQNPGYDDNDYDKPGKDIVIVPPGKGDEPPPPPPTSPEPPKGEPGKGEPDYPPNEPGKPGQNPPCNPGQTPPPCDQPGYEPGKGTPCDKPGYEPGQTPPCEAGKDGCVPPGYEPTGPTCEPGKDICTPGYEPGKPGQYPPQKPIDGDCGKGGKFCDDGGPGQWPGQTTSGKPYDKHEVDACLQAFRKSGYDTRGQWGIEVQEIKSLSILGSSKISDRSRDHKIVIIKAVSILGNIEFELVNPNALYCVKKSVAVLEDVYVTSCHQNNVQWYRDVSVLSRVQTRTVDCR